MRTGVPDELSLCVGSEKNSAQIPNQCYDALDYSQRVSPSDEYLSPASKIVTRDNNAINS